MASIYYLYYIYQGSLGKDLTLPFLNMPHCKSIDILKLCGEMTSQTRYDLMENLEITQFFIRARWRKHTNWKRKCIFTYGNIDLLIWRSLIHRNISFGPLESILHYNFKNLEVKFFHQILNLFLSCIKSVFFHINFPL